MCKVYCTIAQLRYVTKIKKWVRTKLPLVELKHEQNFVKVYTGGGRVQWQ